MNSINCLIEQGVYAYLINKTKKDVISKTINVSATSLYYRDS